MTKQKLDFFIASTYSKMYKEEEARGVLLDRFITDFPTAVVESMMPETVSIVTGQYNDKVTLLHTLTISYTLSDGTEAETESK